MALALHKKSQNPAFRWQIVIVKNIKHFKVSESDTTVNCNLYTGSRLCDKAEEILQSSLSDKLFSLTSLSAHTEQKKHRVRSKAGNNQQQDTKNHKIFTIKALLQYNALSSFRNATFARTKLQDFLILWLVSDDCGSRGL